MTYTRYSDTQEYTSVRQVELDTHLTSMSILKGYLRLKASTPNRLLLFTATLKITIWADAWKQVQDISNYENWCINILLLF